MKLRYKIILLIFIVIITYPLAWSAYFHYGTSKTFALHDQSRHTIGYFVLGYLFGKVTFLLAILDELIQIFVKHKTCHIFQIGLNLIGTLIGIILSYFLKINIHNPFKK